MRERKRQTRVGFEEMEAMKKWTGLGMYLEGRGEFDEQVLLCYNFLFLFGMTCSCMMRVRLLKVKTISNFFFGGLKAISLLVDIIVL